MTTELKQLAAWLTAAKCEIAAMESTGSYWKPIWNILESAVPLVLANAKHVRALPGEKTDRKDGRRLASLLRHGLIRASFVPARALRELRDLTRYRAKLLGNGAAERNRIQKVLEDANIKLGSVLSDVFGVSGQRMLHALVKERQVDVDQVARLAHWKLEPKMALIKQALDGHLTDHHCFLIQACLDHMAYLEQQIIKLDARISQYLAPYQKEYELLQTIPGLKEHSAATVLAEIGPDMTHFEDADHLASWAGICPGNNETAGKRLSGRTRKGNPFLRAALVDCAWGVTRNKRAHFRGMYYRIKARRGAKRAIVAVAHQLLTTAYAVLQSGHAYQEPCLPPLSDQHRRHKAEQLARRLKQLGYDVTITPKAA
jgi:transposase